MMVRRQWLTHSQSIKLYFKDTPNIWLVYHTKQLSFIWHISQLTAHFCSLHITLQWTIVNFGLTMVKIGAFLPSNEENWKKKRKKKEIRKQYETRRHRSAAAPPLPSLFKRVNPKKHSSRQLRTPTDLVTLKWPTQHNAEAGAVLQGCAHQASGCLIGRGGWKTKGSPEDRGWCPERLLLIINWTTSWPKTLHEKSWL